MGALKRGLLAALLLAGAPLHAEATARWEPFVGEASSRFGIPAEWIRKVMKAESGGRSLLRGQPVVSPAGAMGLMQLMPGTWREMRDLLRLGGDPFDPRDNILAGTAYLRILYEKFGYPGLFAAYNAGPGRYRAFLSGNRALPLETRTYVAAIADPSRPTRIAAFPAPVSLFVEAATSSSSPLLIENGAGSSSLFVRLRDASGSEGD